jgi:hypothetical protein
MDITGRITRPVARLGCSWSPERIEVTVPAEQLYQLVIWDDGSQKCATLEWVFRQVTLAPGERWQTHVEWRRLP